MTVNKNRLIAYCASGIAFRMVSTAYSFYYVKVFMNLYHIKAYWFQMAQLVYLTWNVINDPLFGYIQDSKRLRITKTRRESILYCGPILVTTFIIPWFPWGDNSWVVGLHLILSLVSWDTVCTFMSLTMSALFVELSDKTEDRILLTKYYHAACILGTPTVLLLEFTSDSLSNFKTFQTTTVLIAVCSALLFLYAGINISSPYDPNTIKRTNSDIHQNNEIDKNISEGNESYCTQVCQYLSDVNFIAFAVTFFFHIFHKCFVNNFLGIVCDHLIPDDVFPKDARKIFYGGIPFISAICVVFGASFATRYSYYKVVQSVYGSMVLAGLIMLYIGQEHTWCLIIFLMLDSCAISVVYAFFGMAQADLADVNKTKYKRERPLSSMVFGTSSLIARPAISLSPMFVAAVLDIYGYSQLKGTESSLELKHAMFMLVCCYPIIIGSIQFVSWSFFKIPCKSEKTILIETHMRVTGYNQFIIRRIFVIGIATGKHISLGNSIIPMFKSHQSKKVAQVSYLIWNAINDPLFAYIQDSTNWKFTKTRRESILYCGPLFALSFLVPWIPWGDSNTIVGLHLIASLFLWDTMFTFMGLAMCSLFTELSQEPEDRIALTRYAQIASIIGSPSIMLLEFTSDNLQYFRAFQMTTVLIAVCSWLLFLYSGLHAHTKYDLKKMKNEDADISHEKNMNESFWKQSCQILSDRNFIAFVITNFFHGLHKAFLSGFMVIVCDQLISDEVISASIRKTFYGAIGIISTVIVIIGAPLLRKYSYFKVIRCSYVYTVLAGLVMFCIGQNHPWCLMLFLLMDSCASGATFGLFNMPLADIADENKRKYMRKHPISSMVFGTNALITKPAFSLSPMFAVAILNSYGYNELKDKTTVATAELKQVMFTLICWYPIIVGIIQFTSWSFYRVRSNKDEISL